MRCPRLRVFLAYLTLGMLWFAPVASSSHAATAQRSPDPIDLLAITLTTPDLEQAGLGDVGVMNSGFFTLDEAVASNSEFQNLDPDDVEERFLASEFEAGAGQGLQLPADPSDPLGEPLRQVSILVYLFADSRGAEAAYEVIADESELENGEDVDDGGRDIGDDSEITILQWGGTADLDVPYTEAELEIRFDRLVLEVATYNFEDQRGGATHVDRDELETVEVLGERLVERAEAALEGEAPNLYPLVLQLESDVILPSFVAYETLNGEPIRNVFETDDAFAARVERQRDRGYTNLLRHDQLLTEPTRTASAARLHTNLFTFDRASEARAYMDRVVDRLSEDPAFTGVEVDEDADQVGDESLAIALERETEGEAWTLNELIVRVGDTVALLWIAKDNAGAENPEVSFDLLTEIGDAQAECMQDGACEEALPMPNELGDLL